MSQNSEIRARITKNTEVLIRATKPEVNLTEPLYAINWFSTKVEWLYHLYNFLAARSVLKIGGLPYFKASVGETIIDDKGSGRRDLLLIVRYPSGEKFKSMMESTYFKLVSVFRMFAVRKFTFGFTHKIDAESASQKSDDLYYAIHYFKTDDDSAGFISKIKELLPLTIVIKYSGCTTAYLLSQEKGKEARQVPHLMSGLVVLQAPTKEGLLTLFSSAEYINLLQHSDNNFISLLNRIF